MLLLLLGACTSPEPVELRSLADLVEEPVAVQIAYEHREDGRGVHRQVITLTFDQLDCSGLADDLRVRFDGQEPASESRGADTREVTEAGEICTRDGLPSGVPTFVSSSTERHLGAPTRIDLSQGTELATILLPGLPELPQITDVRATGPENLATQADGFTDAAGRLVIYPGVSYALELDRTWIPPTPTNGAQASIQRCFLGACEAIVDGRFEGSLLAYGAPAFQLETLHTLSVACSTDEDPGCADVTGLGPLSLAAPEAIFDRADHLHLAWSTLGGPGDLCSAEGLCDSGLVCAEGICE